MTITVTKDYEQGGLPHMAAQHFTSDGAAATLTFGFKPARVTVYNITDGIVWTWVKGFAATKTFKFVSHDTAQINVDTNTQILDNDDGTITIGATAAGTSKVIHVVAEG